MCKINRSFKTHKDLENVWGGRSCLFFLWGGGSLSHTLKTPALGGKEVPIFGRVYCVFAWDWRWLWLTVGAVLPDEVSVEALLDDHFSVVHPHELRVNRGTRRTTNDRRSSRRMATALKGAQWWVCCPLQVKRELHTNTLPAMAQVNDKKQNIACINLQNTLLGEQAMHKILRALIQWWYRSALE